MSDEVFIDSGSLPQLLTFLKLYPQLQQMFGVVAEFKIVLDASAAISDLIHKYQYPDRGRTALEECMRAGVVEVHAPVWLDSEMTASTIPQVARGKSIPEARLHELWLEYRAQLIWDDRFSAPEEFPGADGDLKDIPYVALHRCLSSTGIFSYDKDFDQLGANRLTLDFVISVRTYARATTYHLSIRVGGIMMTGVSIAALCAIIKGIAALVSRLPDWAKCALFIGIVTAALHPGTRKQVLDGLKAIKEMIADVWPDVEKLIDMASSKQAEAVKALDDAERLVKC